LYGRFRELGSDDDQPLLAVWRWSRARPLDPLRTIEPRLRMLSQGHKADVRYIRNAPYSTAL